MRSCARLWPRRRQEGQGGPGHQIEETGVGAVVDPSRGQTPGLKSTAMRTEESTPSVTVMIIPVPPPGATGHARPGPGAPGATAGRTAPRWPETTCAAGATASRTPRSTTMGEDEMPVVDVEQRPEASPRSPLRSTQPAAAGAAETPIDDHVEGQRDEHEEQRGQQPLGPAGPERPRIDPPRAGPLLEEQARHEEPRQHEEQVDPEVAPRGPPEPQVIGHDSDDGDASHPVERGQVSPGDRRRLGRRDRSAGISFTPRIEAHRCSRRQTSGPGLRLEQVVDPASVSPGGTAPPAVVRSRASPGLTVLGRPAGGRFTVPGTGNFGPSLAADPASPHICRHSAMASVR